MGLGAGTVGNYLRRATVVVLQLKETTIMWPDEIERREIARRMHSTYSFVNCVGMADGTLFPLEFKPTHKGEDYYSRKGVNAVNALIVCDDLARIRHLIVGWPGSTHDSRVWTNSKLSQEPSNYFRHSEYLLGDSAFQASSVMIPAFKKPAKAELDSKIFYFNRKLAKARIKTEHSIGLLKTRFQYLKRIRVLLGRKRRTMRRLIRYVTCACILHNLLIAEPVPTEWEEELRAIEVEPLDEDGELNTPLSNEANGGERRNQLLSYLLEVRG